MTQLLDIATNVCIGLLVGVEFTVSAFINPILRRLDSAAQMSATRMFGKTLGTVMPFWYVASLLLLIAEVVVHRHQAGWALLVTGSAIWVAVIVQSLLFMVPINNRLVQSTAATVSEAARAEHRKWDTLHRFRVAALASSLLCFLLAISI
ncbi:MAG TPA: DUF1772 domain-containing protein [Terracidiphilus sp.]|jgi:uncharacterized membrane protein